ncbi:MAG: hypothetical protein FJ276_11245 [Planctomycetes bacterium]|nr:hypothetical protein [Planctomycetota bacterium]
MRSRGFFRRRRRFVRGALAGACVLALVVLLLWFAPAMLVRSPFWPRILAGMAARFDGQIATDSVRLGWFSPIEARGITIRDAKGEPLATVASLRTNARLIWLLTHRGDVGVVRIEQPELFVRLRGDGSNLEDAIAAWRSRPSSSPAAAGTVEFSDGTVSLRDDAAGHDAELRSLRGKVRLAATADAASTATVEACELVSGTRHGTCQAEATWQGAGESLCWSVSAQLESVVLSAVAPVLRRYRRDVELAGSVSGDVRFGWDGPRRQLTVQLRQVSARPLQLTAPAWIGDDRLALEGARLIGECVVSNGVWDVSGGSLECDAGHLELNGRFSRPTAFDGQRWLDLLVQAATANTELRGELNLAQLARILPRTLRVREGTEFESGVMRFHLTGRQESDDIRRWAAEIETSNVAARRNGREITLREPLQLTLRADQTAQAWRVERLDCRSSFLQLNGQGTVEEGSFSLNCDLDLLVSELQRFVDLGALQATGGLNAGLQWRALDRQRVAIIGDGLIEEMELSDSPDRVWREPRLAISLEMEAAYPINRWENLRSARVEFLSAADRLELKLAEPVGSRGSAPAVTCELRGKWPTWLARLRPLLPATVGEIDGTVALDGTVRYDGQVLEVQRAALSSEPFRLQSPGLAIDEERMEASLSGQWRPGAGEWAVQEGTFQTTALALRARDVSVATDPARRSLSGTVSLRADLARLQNAVQATDQQRTWRLLGAAEGQCSLVQRDQAADARWSLKLTDAQLDRRQERPLSQLATAIPVSNATGWTTVWREPAVTLDGTGRYDRKTDTVHLRQFDLSASDQLRVSAQGTLVQPLARCVMDCQGQISYDLSALTARLSPLWGTSVQATGKSTQPIWLRGPVRPAASADPLASTGPSSAPRRPEIVSRELAGGCGLEWQSVQLAGLTVGAGRAEAGLRESVIRADPMKLALNSGTLHLAPSLHLDAEPILLSLAPGPLLSDVGITAAMCQSWLKYIAPLAAETTRAEGLFSLSLRKASMPLDQPAAADADGTLSVKSARLGPSPFARQLLDLADQVKNLLQQRRLVPPTARQVTWLSAPAQDVRFQVKDQRVHHDRLEFVSGDLVVVTRGSVGFDQSLALVAQIPLRDEWLQGDKILSLFKGHTIEVPVSGTFRNPRLDKRALEQLSTQLIRKAAGQLLENELQRGLQQLFGPIQ